MVTGGSAFQLGLEPPRLTPSAPKRRGEQFATTRSRRLRKHRFEMILHGELGDRHQSCDRAGVVPIGEVSEYLVFTICQPVGSGEDVTAFRRRAGLHGHHDVALLDRLGAAEAVCPKSQPLARAKVDPRLRWMGIDACFEREKLSRHVIGARRYWTLSRRRRDERGEPIFRLGSLRADGKRG